MASLELRDSGKGHVADAQRPRRIINTARQIVGSPATPENIGLLEQSQKMSRNNARYPRWPVTVLLGLPESDRGGEPSLGAPPKAPRVVKKSPRGVDLPAGAGDELCEPGGRAPCLGELFVPWRSKNSVVC